MWDPLDEFENNFWLWGQIGLLIEFSVQNVFDNWRVYCHQKWVKEIIAQYKRRTTAHLPHPPPPDEPHGDKNHALKWIGIQAIK